MYVWLKDDENNLLISNWLIYYSVIGYCIFQVYLFFGHLVVSYGLAFVVSLAFEAPMISLEREFLRGRNAR